MNGPWSTVMGTHHLTDCEMEHFMRLTVNNMKSITYGSSLFFHDIPLSTQGKKTIESDGPRGKNTVCAQKIKPLHIELFITSTCTVYWKHLLEHPIMHLAWIFEKTFAGLIGFVANKQVIYFKAVSYLVSTCIYISAIIMNNAIGSQWRQNISHQFPITTVLSKGTKMCYIPIRKYKDYVYGRC